MPTAAKVKPRTLSFLAGPSGAVAIARGSKEEFISLPQAPTRLIFVLPAPWRGASDWDLREMRGNGYRLAPIGAQGAGMRRQTGQLVIGALRPVRVDRLG